MSVVKELIRRLIRSLGWDLRRLENSLAEDLILADVLRMVGPVAVLDVGANIGQYASLIWRCHYDGIVVSFEATREAHADLVRRASGNAKWVVAPLAAVGSHAGLIEINVSANSVSSSILAMKHAHEDAAPTSKYIGKQQVVMNTLDALAAPLIPATGPLFLKIDTQGYEREVLSGASELLPRIAAVQLELSLTQLYVGAPSFVEMVSLLEQLGFELFGIVPGFKNKRTGRLLQVDGFFVRMS
jgi:FkbM family methyltransferase